MKIKYNYEDYYFLSARVRSLENGLVSKEKTARMAEAKGSVELARMLSEYGIVPEVNAYGVQTYDKALSARLAAAYGLLSGVPDKELFSFFTYQYDCHNLKAALKAEAKGVSPAGMLLPYGSVEASRVADAVRYRELSEFPQNMARGIAEAAEAYAKTGNPQKIDLLLDRACFEDIAASVSGNPVGFFGDLLRFKADSLNIFTALRLCRMPSPDAGALMDTAFLPGGVLGKELFLRSVNAGGVDGENAVLEGLKGTEYGNYAERLTPGVTAAAETELFTDDLFMRRVKAAKQTLAGAEVIAGYIVATEYEVKNLRILIAGKTAGRKPEEITGKLRESYV